MIAEPPRTDGNAAAGELRDIFAVEVTTAGGRCAGCSRRTVLAEARMYVQAPGASVRPAPGREGRQPRRRRP